MVVCFGRWCVSGGIVLGDGVLGVVVWGDGVLGAAVLGGGRCFRVNGDG